jgi:hypothetical protein
MATDPDVDPNKSQDDMPTASEQLTTTPVWTALYNDTTSPFNKPWDLSQKADQECWLVASRAATDHVCFDVPIATAETFMELLKDKSKYFCWNLLMSVPLEGDGSYNDAANTLTNGNITMKVNLKNCVNLLMQWTKVSTKHCQQFVQWFNGGKAVKLDDEFKSNPKLRRVITLDCKDAVNKGLVRCYKVQLRIIDQLILHVLKNHLTTSSYKSFLAHKHEFLFINKKTGNEWHSGLILM